MSVAREFEVVVGHDGALSVPADELARHGLGPGDHLRLVSAHWRQSGRRSVRGSLASVASPEAIQDWSDALDSDREERRAMLGSIEE